MGVFLEIVHLDKVLKESTKDPVIINNIYQETEEDKASFNKLIMTKYSGDLLSNMASCECGEIEGEYAIGCMCANCNTVVSSPSDVNLEPLVWMKSPDGVAPLINPIIWSMLSLKFTSAGFNFIRWYCDTTYSPMVKTPVAMNKVLSYGWARGYNNFQKNFFAIINDLFEVKPFKLKKGEENLLMKLLEDNRDVIFSEHIPVPNKALLVIDDTSFGTYADATINDAVNAIRTMVGIDTDINNFSIRTKENRTAKTLSELSNYYESLYGDAFMAGKTGLFRKHIYGTRCHWSFRAVVSSLTNRHHYNEIHIPWAIGTVVFRVHLFNKLLRRDYTPNQAVAFINEHAKKFHPLMNELFIELITESIKPEIGQYGVPSTLQRNPSLERASAQAVQITQIKQDVSDPTISLSIITVRGYNADKTFFLNIVERYLKRMMSLSLVIMKWYFFNCWKSLRA